MSEEIALGTLVRGTHLAACSLAAGGLLLLALVPRAALEAPVARGARAALGAAALTTLLDLWRMAAAASGLPALDALGAVPTLLAHTWYGRVWLARAAVAGLLAVCLAAGAARLGAARPRAAAAAAALLLATAPLAGHVIAADTTALALWQAAHGVLHAAAAGVWLGGLPFLALALRGPAAAETARRFSALALAAVGLLVATGLANAFALVGSVPALLGTAYGRLLLAKVALLLPILALAAQNRLRDLPRTATDPTAAGRVRRRALAEAALGLGALALAAALSATPPGLHEDPVWPFDFRFTDRMLADAPALAGRLQTGVLLGLFGAAALVYAALFRSQRRGALLAAAGLAAGAWFAIGPVRPYLTIDAYPTTYVRPPVPYDVVSLASGLALYGQWCASCHGPQGRGDGPAAGPALRPADLTAAHTADHTAGDLYWWITNGIPWAERRMPAFGEHLTEEARWDLVNAVRHLSDGWAARALTAEPASPPAIVAPDFAGAGLPGPLGTLRDARGTVVHVVLPGADGSPGRVAALERAVPRLRAAGGALAVLRPGAAPEATAVYGRFRMPADREGHVELLIDRQGYLRARWSPGLPGGWDDLSRLESVVRRLAEEPPGAPPADAHVH